MSLYWALMWITFPFIMPGIWRIFPIFYYFFENPILYCLLLQGLPSWTFPSLYLPTLLLNFLLLFSSSVDCLTLCDPMDCSTPGFSVLHYFPELAQTHVHWVGNAMQLSHPLSSPSPSAFNLSQHQGLFKWVSSSNQVAKVLELQLQHQSFQWIFSTDFL